MKYFFGLLFAIFLTSPASSQDHALQKLRAGEHDGFSRVVIPANRGATVMSSGHMLTIDLDNPHAQIDLSEITEGHKVSRIKSAELQHTSESAKLIFQLTCDCRIQTSATASSELIIDIFDRATTAETRKPAEEAAAPIEEVALPADPKEVVEQSETEKAIARLTRILSKANETGAVEFRNTRVGEMISQHAEASQPVAEAAPVELVASAPADEHPEPLEIPSVECLSANEIIKAREKLGADPFGAIAALSRPVEFVSAAEQEALDESLALSYLSIGFFTEASAIASGRQDAKLIQIAALADLLSRGSTPDQKTLPVSCGALGILAHAIGAKDLTAVGQNETAVLATLPNDIKSPFIEKLGLIAINNGNTQIAAAIVALANHTGPQALSPELAFVEAQLAAHAPQDRTGPSPTLQELALTPSAIQTDAMLSLAEAHHSNPSTLSDDDRDALIAELKDAARLGPSADKRAKVIFAAARFDADAGNFDSAISTLAETKKHAPNAANAARAQSFATILETLSGEDKTQRAKVLSAYLKNDAFLKDGTIDKAVANAIMNEFSDYGANELVASTARASNLSPLERDLHLANAFIRKSDLKEAARIAGQHNNAPEFFPVLQRIAFLRADHRAEMQAARLIASNGSGHSALAGVALRQGAWREAANAYQKTLQHEPTPEHSELFALASLAAGDRTMPALARNILGENPAGLALSHMFRTPPKVELRSLSLLAQYAEGVRLEETFIRERTSYD